MYIYIYISYVHMDHYMQENIESCLTKTSWSFFSDALSDIPGIPDIDHDQQGAF